MRRARCRRRFARRSLLALPLSALLVGGTVAAGALLREDGPRARVEARPTRTATRPTTAASTLPPTTTTLRDPRRGNGQPVTLAFGGDVHFEGGLRGKLRADPQGVLAPIAPVLAAADVAVVNLETAITERGAPQLKEFTFRTSPIALAALAAAGVDAVSMANNHALDYGPDGLADSLAAKAATPSPAVIGIGASAAEAFTPWRLDVKGQRVSVIAATQVLERNLVASWSATDTQGGLAAAKEVDRLLAAVQAARLDSDTVVVFVHWGTEGETCPSEAQRVLGQQLVDAGADLVVGSHAHRLQGAGRLGTAFVGYRARQLRLVQRERAGGSQRRAPGHRHRPRRRRLLVGTGPDPRRGPPAAVPGAGRRPGDRRLGRPARLHRAGALTPGRAPSRRSRAPLSSVKPCTTTSSRCSTRTPRRPRCPGAVPRPCGGSRSRWRRAGT
ncbi:MAG: CapA family protein [Acidimicrobiia bacterium]